MVTIKPVKKDLVHFVGLNNIPYFFHSGGINRNRLLFWLKKFISSGANSNKSFFIQKPVAFLYVFG
jgi:hypothetical protein